MRRATPSRAALGVALGGALLLGGCDSPAGDSAALPLAWDYPVAAAPTPVAADVLQARIQYAIDNARTFNTGPFQAGYTAAMEGQDDQCPAYSTQGDFIYWYDDCVSASGAAFDGYVVLNLIDGDMGEAIHHDVSMWGAATVTEADGRVLHLGGRVESSRAENDTELAWFSRVKGTLRWDGAEADGTWLGEGYGLALELVANYMLDGSDARMMQLDGAIDGFDAPLATVGFDTVTLYDFGATADATCTLEPSGAITVRDTDANTYEIRFDGVTAPGVTPTAAQCDGCGTVSFAGEPLYDSLCFDFRPLTDWDTSGPW